MKCWGRTKLHKRCKNNINGLWPFCSTHRHQIHIYLLTVLILPMAIYIAGRYIYENVISQSGSSDCIELENIFSKNDNDYRVLIFDFMDFDSGNSNIEYKIQSIVESINQTSHKKVVTQIANCNSNLYKIYTLNDAMVFCKENKIDLLIFGEIEEIGESKRIDLKYASNPIIESINQREQYIIEMNVSSIIDITNNDGVFRLLKDIILWNLGGIAGELKTEDGNNLLLKYLGEISTEYDSLYYTSKIVSSLILKSQNKLDLSILKLNEAIDFNPNWASSYYERSMTHLKMEEIDKAASDFKLFKIASADCYKDEKQIFFSSYVKFENGVTPVTYSQEFTCNYDSTYISTAKEFGYCLLLQDLVDKEENLKYLEMVIKDWKLKHPNSPYLPLNFE